MNRAPNWLVFTLLLFVCSLPPSSFAQQPADEKPAAEAKAAGPAEAAKSPAFDPGWLKGLRWRSIGPASMGGRIVDLMVNEKDPTNYYVVTATGGIFKTINNGTTFEPLFQQESVISLGDACVSPSSPDILWVGTGEHNARNSVSWGDGVYRSTDGGKTWKNMGLRKSYQIGRIAVHPTNPYIVYVGALGRLWGTSEERGVYKTTDGGETWERVLYIDEKTGCIDLQLAPDDPETLIAAMYERQRDEFDVGDPAKRWGAGSGLHKSTDGGKTWKKLTQGLPTAKMGRIGIDHYRKDPKTVFAIIETEQVGKDPSGKAGDPALMGISGEDGDEGAKLTRITTGGPAEKAGLKADDVVTAVGDKPIKKYDDLVGQIGAHKAGDKVKVKARRGDEAVEVELTFVARAASGGDRPFGSSLGGQQENVQSRQGDEGFQTGGVFKSTDGGETWTRINSLNPRPFYYSQVRVDPSDENFLYVLGISLYRSEDGGKTFRNDAGRGVHADHHAMWIDPRDGRHIVLGCDGGLYASFDRTRNWEFHGIMALGQFYHVAVDTKRPYNVYGGLQDNGSWGGPSAMRGTAGPDNSDWHVIGSGDGFVCQVDPNDPDQLYYESQYGRLGRLHLKTGERATIRAPEGKTHRFNWKTPFILSNHNSRIYYAAGNYVMRSMDRGKDLRVISAEITRTNRGSATALAESPKNPDVLYVGTDDGAFWVTRNGGHEWTNLTGKITGLPGTWCVDTIECSRFKEGRVYVTFDGHRNDDDAPYLFVSEDFGRNWKSLRANLPEGSARCLREDVTNENLLYAGTEFAIWVSLNRGGEWIKLNNNLPTAAVHEIAVHPTAGEIVAATHGRSLWVLDVMPLRQLTEKVLTAKAHLFEPPATIVWAPGLTRRFPGHKRFLGENPAGGAGVYYSLAEKADKVSLEVVDRLGKTVRELKVKNEPGLHQAVWDVRLAAERRTGNQQQQQPTIGPRAEPGIYRIVLSVDGKRLAQDLTVEADPEYPAAVTSEEDVAYDKEPEGY